MKSFKKLLFFILQWTWGLPVNAVGGTVYLFCRLRGYRTERFACSYLVFLPWNAGGLSLGLFIFVKAVSSNREWTCNTCIHEYGHTWQCLILGPFYWMIIGLPSAVWYHFFEGYRQRKKKSYYSFFTERWADSLGQKASGMMISGTGDR